MIGEHGGSSRSTDNRAAEQNFAVARTVVANCWPFFTGPVMRLCPRWTRGLETLAVDDRWRLYMNPEWIAAQHPSKLALILAGHELMHVLGDHSIRLTEYRDVFLVGEDGRPECSLANVAHDLAINTGLKSFVDAGLAYRRQSVGGDESQMIPLALPAEGYYPANFTDRRGRPFPEGLISEDYALLLTSELEKSKRPLPGCGPGRAAAGCGKCGSGGGGPAGEYEEVDEPDPADYDSGVIPEEQELIRTRTAKAAQEQAVKLRGTVPGNVEIWAKVVLTPSKVAWDRLLRQYVRGAMNKLMGRYDYCYAVPNRRSQDASVILPGMCKPEPKFVVAIDVSGSMGPSDYAEAFGHVAAILRSVGFRKVPVFCCDSRASEIQYVSDIRQVKMVGGGGTDMGVAIRKVVEMRGPRLVVVLSDGHTPWPSRKEGGVNVVACLTDSSAKQPPAWIKTVRKD